MALKSAVALAGLLRLPAALRAFAAPTAASFSVLDRPPPNYEGHIPLTTPERGALAVGSAVMSLLNPRRGGTLPIPQPNSGRYVY